MSAGKLLPLLALLALGAAPAPGPRTCTPGPYIVFFEWNSSAIHTDATAILDEAVEASDACGPFAMALAAHIDTSERPEISGQRLKAVSNYFAARGVFVKSEHLLDYGAKNLRVATPPNTQERQNRRVEITFGPDL